MLEGSGRMVVTGVGAGTVNGATIIAMTHQVRWEGGWGFLGGFRFIGGGIIIGLEHSYIKFLIR